MELWDLLDKNRQPLGITHPRGRQYPMPPHTYHTVVSVFTVDADNRLLLTLRAPTKGMYPGYWEFTGGSGVAGEASLTSAWRELSEETGITVSKEELIFLGTLREPSAFMDCYLCRLTKAGKDVIVTLQEGETVDYQWVTFREFETMIHKGLLPPPCAMRYGFVKQALTDIIGDDAWLQLTAEEVSTLETTAFTPKEDANEP
ncbi:MAG: NUDIX domain-containing protein [Clostridia bacterium]|nr:NUDIX domain-containing protein [Clostridia bacterium]